MASRKKPAAALTPQIDPKAPLDVAAFVAAAKKHVQALAEDLLARADGSAGVTAGLRARHADEQKADRTADGYEVWRRRWVAQVAAAWLLSVVFVRTLEDRGLVERHRIAGPGAADGQRQFFQLAPHLTERDYLLTVFRELSRVPAAKDLFDERHNPVWRLAPSAEGARALLDLFRAPGAEAPAFRFGQEDTRFLGDLYQDLDDDVRERFALLQTPHFVEQFILDRTLDPAIAEFGLDGTTLLDPTCGSGHFLLGGFERLYDARLRETPGIDVREAARRALDAVFGVDLNPYAVAIARFRLTLAYVEKTGFAKLADAPDLPLHVLVADSLLHAEEAGGQQNLGDVEGASLVEWKGEEFALDDEAEAKRVLRMGHAAVVGNPPYITVKDAALREKYRKLFPDSASKQYALAAPFADQFFRLTRKSGFVGQITANSFMKREFGKKLIERVFPRSELTLVVNTSGAYIPGHGTPTVLLFGRRREPASPSVSAVLAKRGEPSTPDEAALGLVWKSIADHWSETGYENDYISVVAVNRSTFARHPWSLGGGGAAELKELLEGYTNIKLGDMVDGGIGRGARAGSDDIFMVPPSVAARSCRDASWWRPVLTGEDVRDWSAAASALIFFPYAGPALTPRPEAQLAASGPLPYLWAYRTLLRARGTFQGDMAAAGLEWFEYMQYTPSANTTALSITFAFVATHNHFVLDRGGKVFNRHAPIIKLPPSATEDDHLALLAYLNSSIAGFYFRQCCHSKGAQGVNEGHKAEVWEQFLEYSGTSVGSIPVPPTSPALVGLARAAEALVAVGESLRPHAVVKQGNVNLDSAGRASLTESSRNVSARLCAVQEEIDWLLYEQLGLLTHDEARELAGLRATALPGFPHELDADLGRHVRVFPGDRPFEIQMRTSGRASSWIARNGYDTAPGEAAYEPFYQALLRARARVVATNREIGILESPEHKRRWTLRDWNAEFGLEVKEAVLGEAEACFREVGVQPIRMVRESVERGARVIRLGDATNGLVGEDFAAEAAVPFLSSLRFTASGLEKHRQWQHTWSLQRREDAGETVGEIPVPPKYDQDDYRDAVSWRLRGKLDVPKERFISYPGCESDEDKSPVYGWAGWNHLQQAQALAALYVKRKTEEAWGKERLVPMLAGLDELIPWIKQWHNEPSAEYAGMRLGDYFADFVAGECQVLAVTLDELRAWRPAEKVRGGGKKKKAKPVADELGDGEALSPRGGLRGGRMGAAPWPSPTHA